MSGCLPVVAFTAIFIVAALAGRDRALLQPETVTDSRTLYGATTIFNADLRAFPNWQDVMARAKAENAHDRICASALDHIR